MASLPCLICCPCRHEVLYRSALLHSDSLHWAGLCIWPPSIAIADVISGLSSRTVSSSLRLLQSNVELTIMFALAGTHHRLKRLSICALAPLRCSQGQVGSRTSSALLLPGHHGLAGPRGLGQHNRHCFQPRYLRTSDAHPQLWLLHCTAMWSSWPAI